MTEHFSQITHYYAIRSCPPDIRNENWLNELNSAKIQAFKSALKLPIGTTIPKKYCKLCKEDIDMLWTYTDKGRCVLCTNCNTEYYYIKTYEDQ